MTNTSYVRFHCDNCSKKLRTTSERRGQRVRCPKCRSRMLVPTADEASAVAAAVAPALPRQTDESKPATPQQPPVDELPNVAAKPARDPLSVTRDDSRVTASINDPDPVTWEELRVAGRSLLIVLVIGGGLVGLYVFRNGIGDWAGRAYRQVVKALSPPEGQPDMGEPIVLKEGDEDPEDAVEPVRSWDRDPSEPEPVPEPPRARPEIPIAAAGSAEQQRAVSSTVRLSLGSKPIGAGVVVHVSRARPGSSERTAYILTSQHVVAASPEISVTYADGARFAGTREWVGRQMVSLALVKSQCPLSAVSADWRSFESLPHVDQAYYVDGDPKSQKVRTAVLANPREISPLGQAIPIANIDKTLLLGTGIHLADGRLVGLMANDAPGQTEVIQLSVLRDVQPVWLDNPERVYLPTASRPR